MIRLALRSNLSIIEKILDRLNKPKSLIKHISDRPGHDRRYSIDSSKTNNELGCPQRFHSMKELKKIEWYVSREA